MSWDPLARFVPRPPTPGVVGDPGLFGPGSAAWRLGRERVLLAGGPAALLLQVAHPLVAAGVAAHSDFAGDPLRRLHGTLDATLTVTFGDTAQARSAAAYVGQRHRPVRGALPVTTGTYAGGTPYRADDADLALWVFATLVWSAVVVTEQFVRPVATAERDAYYRDMTAFGRLFGVPDSALPGGYAALDAYVDRQVAEVLAVGPAAARISRQVLLPDPPVAPPLLRAAPAILAAGILPPPVREQYGLPWGRRERLAFRVTRHAVRHAVPLLPAGLRYWPHYLVARRRHDGRTAG
ncbi:MAG: DUF2236 domain-containing protein [Actinomycetota bacterium]|nr:DUF2236 domain-containing protein [Actinomycetota bacterium]